MKNIEFGPIRPVAEADSLLVRVTRGCSWNKCHFCTQYKDFSFSIRKIYEIKRDIDNLYEKYGKYNISSCFLQDGDSIIMKTDELIEIIEYLKERFPNLEQLSSYGRASSLVRKSEEDYRRLKDAGLTRIYCGMESGSDDVLKKMNKGITSSQLVEAAGLVKSAGMELSVFIILGLGGRELSKKNAVETAETINLMKPDFVRVRTVALNTDTRLRSMSETGEYTIQSEEEIVYEQRSLIENITIHTRYSSDHYVNLLEDVNGKLPDEREQMLEVISDYESLDDMDRQVFNLGKRGNFFRKLLDFDKGKAYNDIRNHYNLDKSKSYDNIRYICSELRKNKI
ncbi:Radical SAM superfamily protein [Dethiosulfatibacter aminovorans DSM 17477]|uniref:Radical SAM superfamily protein n=1 Tax=Dethiosulfatibacter aminovorans DSM 17477 TaxID=1121476 RepID=A0A1M6M4T7_9FIRM|nr:radical SAM protein [Dethiosulfatibacter aminovorans]SHJ78498.1 Radical SAM superfamily protein [Dethiosulfatibacter aminovorans DSM 17477]